MLTLNNIEDIKLCDTNLVNNYDIEAENYAIYITEYGQFEECPNINYSCCQKEVILEGYKKLNLELIPSFAKKYMALEHMLRFLVLNYQSILKYAYVINSLERKHQVCKEASENIIFTPINKNFADEMIESLKKTIEFSIKSK